MQNMASVRFLNGGVVEYRGRTVISHTQTGLQSRHNSKLYFVDLLFYYEKHQFKKWGSL